jgi:predicted acetyltransferase
MSFRRYLEVLGEQERGENLAANHVPATFLFAFAGPRIVGRVSIRHSLNPYLERFGGHIGYAVVPQYRRQGYATEILRQSLQIAREKLGLKRVLVTCDDDNVGSIKTIERNGGVLENIVTGPVGSRPVCFSSMSSRDTPTRPPRAVRGFRMVSATHVLGFAFAASL